MRRLLLILLIALQPAMLVGASAQGPARHQAQGCCLTDCCCEIPQDCLCEADTPSEVPAPAPQQPSPQRVRISDLFAESITALYVIEIPAPRLAPVPTAGAAPIPVPLSQRLSLLCLWLT